jgi:hypothetical protein
MLNIYIIWKIPQPQINPNFSALEQSLKKAQKFIDGWGEEGEEMKELGISRCFSTVKGLKLPPAFGRIR